MNLLKWEENMFFFHLGQLWKLFRRSINPLCCQLLIHEMGLMLPSPTYTSYKVSMFMDTKKSRNRDTIVVFCILITSLTTISIYIYVCLYVYVCVSVYMYVCLCFQICWTSCKQHGWILCRVRRDMWTLYVPWWIRVLVHKHCWQNGSPNEQPYQCCFKV